MRVETFNPLLGRRLDHDPPATLERLQQQGRQHLLQRLPFQVIKQNFSHPALTNSLSAASGSSACSGSRGCVSVGRNWQSQVRPQRLALIVGSEQAAALQFRNYLIDKIVKRAR